MLDPMDHIRQRSSLRKGSKILRTLLLSGLFLILSKEIRAQTFDSLETDRLTPKIHANGLIGQDTLSQAADLPYNGNEKGVLASAGLWLTGEDVNSNAYNATPTWIDPSSGDTAAHFYPGPIADQYGSEHRQKYRRVWKIERDSIQYHAQNWWKSGYQMPAMIEEWPAHGDTSNGEAYELAPYEDRNDNGKYDPENGDRPIMRGDRAIYFIANDIKGPVDSGKEGPFGVEVHGMLYVWDCPNDEPLNNSFMLHYEIINRSQKVFYDTHAGVFSDFDIGCPQNDHIGGDYRRAMLFAYNGTDEDTGCGTKGYGSHPPAFGNIILKGVQKDSNGADDPGCGTGHYNGTGLDDGIVDNEHWGLTDGYHFLSGTGPQAPPQSSAEFINYTRGYWRDGIPFTFGGDAYDPTGSNPPTDLVFPWDSDPEDCVTINPQGFWSEDSAGNASGDKKGISGSGTVTFQAGDTLELDVAFVAAQDPDTSGALSPLDELRGRAEQVHQYFRADSVPCSDGSFTSVEEAEKEAAFDVEVYPNPSKGRFHVELESETQREYRYALYSMRGAHIDEGNWQGGGKRTLELGDEQQGIYFLRIRSEQGAKVMKLVKE